MSQRTPSRRAILISQTGKEHRCPPPTTQQRSPRSGRQMLIRSHWHDDSCLSHPAASHSTNISPTCPNVSAAKRSLLLPHRRSPTTLHDLQKRGAVVLTNDTQLSPDAKLTSSPCTRAQRHTSNNPSQGSHYTNPAWTDRTEHAWISSSNYVAARTKLTRPLPSSFSSNGVGLMICRQRSPRLRGQTRRKERVRQIPPHQPGPIHP